ncbi:hypothetical protein JHK87_022713 [Glycine soja]|nr:hypothetical protein JHK87_022713 [Glycine soja]
MDLNVAEDGSDDDNAVDNNNEMMTLEDFLAKANAVDDADHDHEHDPDYNNDDIKMPMPLTERLSSDTLFSFDHLPTAPFHEPDSKGFLSFNFEGSLNVAPSSSFVVAPSSLLILHNSSTIAFAGSNKGLAAPTPSAVDLVGSDNVPDQWNFRQMVCRHWLHHLCMKGDAYGFLHQYNKERMLVCHFFRLYGEYWKQDGSGDYALVHEDKKETLS